MNDTELVYHLNFRQKDLYDAADAARLAHLAQKDQPKPKMLKSFLMLFVKLSISALLVYELAVMIYG